MDNRGAIMPVILMLCFILSGLLLFQIKVFVNEKQNVILEEQVLRLEWLLRNGEQKWRDDIEKQDQNEGYFYFPDGQVYYNNRPKSPGEVHVIFIAKDNKGMERTHSFVAKKQKE